MTKQDNLVGRTGIPNVLSRVTRVVARRLFVHENVVYGSHFRVGRNTVISSPHGLTVGRNVSVGPHSIIQVDGSIGDFVLIGMGVQIVGRNDHAIQEVGVPIVYSTWVGDRPPTPSDAVHIERDVWIGGGTVVLSGVCIGEGSIIGAGSVVTSDVPDYSVAVGNPARVVRSRFDTHEEVEQHRRALDQIL